MQKSKFERLRDQLLEAERQQLVRGLMMHRNLRTYSYRQSPLVTTTHELPPTVGQAVFSILLHPHQQTTVLQKLITTLITDYNCVIAYREANLLLEVTIPV